MKTFLYTFLFGAIYALGFPNIIAQSLLITPILGLGFLLYFLLKEKKFKNKLYYLLAFNLGFTLTGFYWIADTLNEFGSIPIPFAIILNSLFALIVIPYLWPVLFLSKYSYKLKIDSGLKTFSLAIIFSLLEYATPQQFDTFIGSPWIVFSKYLGFAPISGVIIYSFFSFLIIFEGIRFYDSRQVSKVNVSLIILFIVLNPFIISENKSVEKELNIRLVQANISNYLKVNSETGDTASSSEVINAYKALSLKKSDLRDKIDLIIWPETAYPFSILSDDKKLNQTNIPVDFLDIAQIMNVDFITGGYSSTSNYSSFMTDYNTAFHISPKGKLLNTYHKQVLIPFGETLPFGPFNKLLSKYITNISFFAEGERYSVFNIKNEFNVMLSICYEILKPDFFRKYLNSLDINPDFMVNLTNDSWYGKTMEPYQHLFLSRWRAIEFRLPIVRSTNTGISSVIYPDGSESRRTGVFKSENLDVKLRVKPRQATLFQRFGITTIFPLWLIGLILALIEVKLKNEK